MKLSGSSFLGSFYENFFGRDLAYIIGGAAVIFSFQYAIVGNLRPMVHWVARNGYQFLVFLGGSYTVGLIVKEFWTGYPVRLLKTSLELDRGEKDPTRELIATNIASRLLEPRTIRLIERHIFLEHVGAVLASSALTSGLVVLLIQVVCRYSPNAPVSLLSNSAVFIFLAVALVIAVWGDHYNRRINARREELYSQLRTRIEAEGYDWRFTPPSSKRNGQGRPDDAGPGSAPSV